jgi:hypothetical protein
MRLFFFILAVAVLFLVPKPEEFVVRLVEYAGLVLIVARGLAGHYEDLVKVLEGNRQDRRSLPSAEE